jgi:hypothetical protein
MRAVPPRGTLTAMWIFGVIVVVVIGACVIAIFFLSGSGPFVALSQLGKRDTSISPRGDAFHFDDDLKKPPNEQELL